MIITKIVGGLGNQMFQYAIGRAAAEKHGLPLLLDTYDFKTYRRPYFLDKFNIKEDYLPDAEAAKFRKYEKRHSPRLLWENLKPIKQRAYRLEKPKEYFKFIPDFLVPASNRDTYFNGYWQNDRYFSEIRNILLDEFTLKPKHAIGHGELLDKALSQGSISLHFRRGDDQINKIYGAPSLEYYRNSITRIAERQPNDDLKLLIFTNDVEWVKQNAHFDIPSTYVSEQGKLTDYQELMLMSCCHHNIIANSTFSWWAAWLNDKPNRMICAPDPWFINKPDAFETTGLLPQGWIKIKT